mgnify:CR=1 FL=1
MGYLYLLIYCVVKIFLLTIYIDYRIKKKSKYLIYSNVSLEKNIDRK